VTKWNKAPRWGGLVPNLVAAKNCGCTITGLRTLRVTLTNGHFCTPLCTALGVHACTPLAHFQARTISTRPSRSFTSSTFAVTSRAP